jgi:hypothetical protein
MILKAALKLAESTLLSGPVSCWIGWPEEIRISLKAIAFITGCWLNTIYAFKMFILKRNWKKWSSFWRNAPAIK